MSGIPEFNFPAFFKAQAELENQGWKVFNPANKDEEKSLDADACKTGDAQKVVAAGFDFRKAFMWDCEKIIFGDAIYMLKGWETSPGATAEHRVAVFIKKCYPEFQIFYQQ